MSRTPDYLLIDQCPSPYIVSPYIYLVLRRAGQTASSIYRGVDKSAQPLLRRFGKHNQAQIHLMYPTISNPAGQSQHDLHNYDGSVLPPWHVGVDSGTDDPAAKAKIEAAAKYYGLTVYHPYPRGVEGHHWAFAVEPKPNRKLSKAKVAAVRLALRMSTRKQMRGHW